MTNNAYRLGAVRTFDAVTTVLPGADLDEATESARLIAYADAEAWGAEAPRRIGLFRIFESWALREERGTWLLTFTVQLRVVDPAETITLPGGWDYTSGEFLS